MYDRGSGRWRLTVLLVPGAFLAVIVLTVPVLAGRLPDPLAAGWTAGIPSGGVAGWAVVVITTYFWLLFVAGLRYSGRKTVPGPEVLAIGYAVGGALASGQIVLVMANLDAVTWEAAGGVGHGPWVAVASAAAAAGIGWWLGGGRRRAGTVSP